MAGAGRVVGVFGMGLLGGSVALGLRERFAAGRIHAYDLDPSAVEGALALGVADVGHTSLGAWVGELDVGVLASPVRTLEGLGRALAPWSAPATIWLDVGSVKGSVVAELEGVLPRFVGTHPMAGRETPGVGNAFAGLVQSAVWVVTPTPRTDPGALAEVEAMITALGAYPIRMDADVHDRLVARISHVPWLLAVALNRMIGRDADRERLLALAAGGFRDLTRVASGSPTMGRDMLCENKDAVRGALADLRVTLAELEAALDDPEALRLMAEESKRTRDALPIVKRSILPRMYDVVVAIPDRPMELARLTTTLGEAGVDIRDIEILKVRDTGGEAIRVGVKSAEDEARARAALAAAGYLGGR
ncbi:MAG: prephenate dehydrogenase/arogenate dehydrogenase family protein [Deltaproteobacteria bacterium]|nr:prephenate dehydrogenase/arogenate dehydrogenase family protein [Deltaproteobacteria bacterium]